MWYTDRRKGQVGAHGFNAQRTNDQIFCAITQNGGTAVISFCVSRWTQEHSNAGLKFKDILEKWEMTTLKADVHWQF